MAILSPFFSFLVPFIPQWRGELNPSAATNMIPYCLDQLGIIGNFRNLTQFWGYSAMLLDWRCLKSLVKMCQINERQWNITTAVGLVYDWNTFKHVQQSIVQISVRIACSTKTTKKVSGYEKTQRYHDRIQLNLLSISSRVISNLIKTILCYTENLLDVRIAWLKKVSCYEKTH